mgnify:CR=1 FL=1
MVSEVILFTYKSGEIDNFLNRFYSSSSFINNNSYIKLSFLNPLELSELIAAFSDNKTLFDIDMIANNQTFGHGVCGSKSGSIPANVGEPTIRIQNMTVGGSGGKN